MSVLTRLFTRQPEAKRSRGMQVHFTGLSAPVWSKNDYGAYSREGYELNVIAHSAINRIANAVSSIEWNVKINGESLDRHPVLDLLNRPNPAQSKFDWWRARVSYLLLAGNNYDEKVQIGGPRKLELWTLRPDRMKIVPGASGLPAQYEYKVGMRKVLYPVDQKDFRSNILHSKLFHPTDDYYGMSPISAGAYSVDQHNEAMNWVQSLLQNSARPSGALVVDKETNLTDEQFNRLKAEVEEKYTGSENAGRPMLLEGGMDWKSMGLSPMDMEILKIKESAARDISLAFGVPPLLLNIPGDNTYANYREARLGFYEDTILPFVEYQAAELSYWLEEEFGTLELEPDKDKIEAIADKRTKMWEMADNSDDLTLNESRALKGYPPLPDPLGSTLMPQIRSMAKPDDPNSEEPPTEETIKRLAYGKSY